MTRAAKIKSPLTSGSAQRPFIASYDLGYEYSQQHYIALQCMVEDADEEASFARVPQLEETAA
jgi:hypothetical protein